MSTLGEAVTETGEFYISDLEGGYVQKVQGYSIKCNEFHRFVYYCSKTKRVHATTNTVALFGTAIEDLQEQLTEGMEEAIQRTEAELERKREMLKYYRSQECLKKLKAGGLFVESKPEKATNKPKKSRK